MSQSVDFVDNKLQFRFIDLDLSVTLSLTDDDFLFIPGFNSSNAAAHLNVPRDAFAKLFYYCLQYTDLSNNDFTKIKHAMNSSGWYGASYSNAIVDVSNQIITGSVYQNIKYDYIRYILKQITGTNTTNGLFRNTSTLMDNVVSMDAAFNSQILNILLTCGTLDSPQLNTTYSNNPGKVLIDSILANDNVIETDNTERRTALISKFTTNIKNSGAFYVIGTKYGDTKSYCHFPIYTKAPDTKTDISFAEYPGYTFYRDPSYVQYTSYDSVFNTSNDTTYYLLGTIGIEPLLYHYPLFINKTKTNSTQVTFSDASHSNFTFYTSTLISILSVPENTNTIKYINFDTLNMAYYLNATKANDTRQKIHFPIYTQLSVTRQEIIGGFTDVSYCNRFYTNYPSYDNSFNINKTSATYINATRKNTTLKQDYKVYLNSGVGHTNAITFTDASYSGTTFYTECRNYDSTPSYINGIKTGTNDAFNYYPIYREVTESYTTPITFDEYPGVTFYTDKDTPFYLNNTKTGTTSALYYYPIYSDSSGTHTTLITFTDIAGSFYTIADSPFFLNNTKTGTTSALYYYPIYSASGDTHTTLITFTDLSETYYTTSSLTSTPYKLDRQICDGFYLYGTRTGTTSPQYHPVFLKPTGVFKTPITLTEYSGTFYTDYINYLSDTNKNSETPYYYFYSTNNIYYFPAYTTSSDTHTTEIPLGSLTFYQGSLSNNTLSYDQFALINYTNVTTAYYINGTKTGTTSSATYFPIYPNYTGHYSNTPITFTDGDYAGVTFYTDYEVVNNTYYPFTFEYGDSLSVRLTYKPKYNTYLGREIKDYSYQVYLDMGIDNFTVTPYKTTGDENPAGTNVASITYYDSTIYTSIGTSKVFHYVLQNSNLPTTLYESPYNFYPTLFDISNVSFDVSSNSITGRWVFSVFCRPRSDSEYAAVGFDRFDTVNIMTDLTKNKWNRYDINSLKWTNYTTTQLSWQEVLDLSIVATTTPYGDIKVNSQQQIMVLAISTSDASYIGSIRNVSVIFKDGRTITLS